jgi:DNA-binding winged helix-turn-helix (wHTH) protein
MVWGDVAVTENALTRCIREVRAALGDEVQNPAFLRTIPRLGYFANTTGDATFDQTLKRALGRREEDTVTVVACSLHMPARTY